MKTLKQKINESFNESKLDRVVDDIFFIWDDHIEDGRQGIEHGNTGGGSQFVLDASEDGFTKFKKEALALIAKKGLKVKVNKVKSDEIWDISESLINEGIRPVVKQFYKKAKSMRIKTIEDLQALADSSEFEDAEISGGEFETVKDELKISRF